MQRFSRELHHFVFHHSLQWETFSGDWRSVIIALVPRILLGYLAGVIFEFIKNKFNNENAAAVIGALIGTITNTVLVLGGIYFFFGTAYADAVNIAYSSLLAMLFGVVTTNGIVEHLLGRSLPS